MMRVRSEPNIPIEVHMSLVRTGCLLWYQAHLSEDANGKLTVKKTEKHYEFLTKSKVGKVG
jgi:hypothetical protein